MGKNVRLICQDFVKLIVYVSDQKLLGMTMRPERATLSEVSCFSYLITQL
jgi:hypothetical protein